MGRGSGLDSFCSDVIGVRNVGWVERTAVEAERNTWERWMWTHGSPWLRKGVRAASRSLPGDQGLVNERTEVTGEVKADAGPPPRPLSALPLPQSHTQGVPSFCRLSPQAGISSCWPPGVCLVEAVYRLKMQFELKQFPQ